MADAAEERPRVDGFTWPPHNFQLSSWALFIGFVGSFFALFLAPLEEGARVAAGCVYGVLAALTLVGALTATGKNPADPLIYAASPPGGGGGGGARGLGVGGRIGPVGPGRRAAAHPAPPAARASTHAHPAPLTHTPAPPQTTACG